MSTVLLVRWFGHHVLHGALPPVVTQASLQLGSVILIEAVLSFLGLRDPNMVSQGAMSMESFASPGPEAIILPVMLSLQ